MNNNGIPSIEEQVAALEQKEDRDIDLSDIPEILDWSGAVRGKLYRPVKRQISLRLDADVLEWFKQNHPQYQTVINAVLRHYAATHAK